MLYNVIQRVASDTGLDIVQDRKILNRLFNNGSHELHFRLECNAIMREVTLVVPSNKVISLPAYIGECRGLRVHTNEMLVDLKTMAVPRYTNSTLQYRIRNWRDLGTSAVHTNVSEVGPLTLNTTIIDSPVASVTITGQTPTASRIEEKGAISAVSLQTTNSFGPAIFAIASFDKRSSDIQILDGAGVEIAILYNKFNYTRYKLIDVSQVFWPQNDTVNGETLMDVLYKLPFIPAINDTDSFAAGDDYDDVLYHMAMYLYYMPMAGKEAEAQSEKVQAFESLKSIKDSEEDGINKKLNFGRGKFMDIFKRGRYTRGSAQDEYGEAGYAWPYYD